MGWAMKGRRDGSIITAIDRRKPKRHRQPLLLLSDADKITESSKSTEEKILDKSSTSDLDPTAATNTGTADDTTLALDTKDSDSPASDSPEEVDVGDMPLNACSVLT